MWQAFVRPIMEYAGELWEGAVSTGMEEQLEKVQTDWTEAWDGTGSTKLAASATTRKCGGRLCASKWSSSTTEPERAA